METVLFSADDAETGPFNKEQKVRRFRLTQKHQFDRYVQKELAPDREAPAQSLREILEGHANYGELAPENVLQAVEKAVEIKIPIEAIFERRHEAKDEDMRQAAAQAATVSAIDHAVSQQFIAPVAKVAPPTALGDDPTKPDPTGQTNDSVLVYLGLIGFGICLLALAALFLLK